jgi:hypothetical protein
MSEIDVEFVKWGFADRYPGKNKDIVCVNRNMKDYPELLRSVLKHETSHDHGKTTKKDFMLDITIGNQISFKNQLFFMIKNPTAFAAILPIRYSKRWGIIIDKVGIAWWSLMLIILMIVLFTV